MANIRRKDDVRAPGGADGMGWLYLALFVAFMIFVAWSVIAGGFWLAGESVQFNPMAVVLEAVLGVRPPVTQSLYVLGGWIGAFVLVVVFALLTSGGSKKSTGAANKTVLRKARTMARPNELHGVAGQDSVEKAQRLYAGADAKNTTSLGLIIGRTVAKPHTDLRMSWEDTAVILAGQRMGKTQSYVTTSILSAPGACVATGNKRDIIDLTRYGREQIPGSRIWVFDLQRIATNGEMDWWWNPLDMVASLSDARKLGDYFAAGASTGDNARSDVYFQTASQELLAQYIFAAALGGGDMLHVLEWLKNDTDTTPANILVAKGENVVAQSVLAAINLSSKQKDGVYSMAANYIATLSDSQYASALVPRYRVSLTASGGEVLAVSTAPADDPLPERPRFDPVAFVTSKDTVYALTSDDASAPAPITTALFGQITDAAQKVARKHVGGRLSTPLVCVLDEAANVVRLRELPALYSYAGSQGIVLMTFLQSASQGKNVWGQNGFSAMVESSNVVIYGGGIKDTSLLKDISDLIGDMRVQRSSTSVGTHTSYSTQYEREAIMSVDDLASLSDTHSVVLTSGNRAVYASKVFWRDSELAPLVEKSLEQASQRLESE